jgi:hypothetical protein
MSELQIICITIHACSNVIVRRDGVAPRKSLAYSLIASASFKMMMFNYIDNVVRFIVKQTSLIYNYLHYNLFICIDIVSQS